MRKQLLPTATLLATGLSAVVMMALVLDQIFSDSNFPALFPGPIQIALWTLVGAMLTLYVSYFFRTLNANPTPLQVALVGGPRTGKTVYLTILFNELQVARTPRIAFQPHGRETIETVGENLNQLNAGTWLKPTSPDSIFFFRADAVIGGNILRRKYTIEIGDHAGERIEEFDSTSEEWLHRTEYFKYVIGCDIIFLAADADKLTNGKPFQIARMENELIAAFQVLVNDKGVAPGQQLRAPVALLILKADLLDRGEKQEKNEHDIHSRLLCRRALARLITLCESRCRFFRVFEVSATGGTDGEGGPPQAISPRGVIEPMVWALHHVTGNTAPNQGRSSRPTRSHRASEMGG